jgi:uncharacterized protein YcfJ
MASSKKTMVGLVAATFAFAATGALAQDPRDPRNDNGYDDRYDNRYDDRYDDRQDGGAYDYAKVVDVQPLTRRVRVTAPVRECWDETRYEQPQPYYGPSRERAGSTLLGAAIGAVIGHQIGHGRGRDTATVAGAVVGGAIGRDQANRRAARNGQYASVPPREYTVERCQTRYRDDWEERTDGYRVTYIYNGRRQVTELPYKPGDRIRVRVDVSPAE